MCKVIYACYTSTPDHAVITVQSGLFIHYRKLKMNKHPREEKYLPNYRNVTGKWWEIKIYGLVEYKILGEEGVISFTAAYHHKMTKEQTVVFISDDQILKMDNRKKW